VPLIGDGHASRTNQKSCPDAGPGNFHRKVTSSAGFLVPTGQASRVDGGRPAELFRPGPAPLLHPAALRPATVGRLIPRRQR